jgi:WW domain
VARFRQKLLYQNGQYDDSDRSCEPLESESRLHSDEQDLPPGWKRYHDDENGVAYFHNDETGTTQWEPPI